MKICVWDAKCVQNTKIKIPSAQKQLKLFQKKVESVITRSRIIQESQEKLEKLTIFIVFIFNATLNRTPDYFKQKSYANSWIFKVRARKLWYRKTAFRECTSKNYRC